MADTPAKRMREAKKRQYREVKAERKRLRKEGLLGTDNRGLFAPGELQRETVDNPNAGPNATPAPEPTPGPTQE